VQQLPGLPVPVTTVGTGTPVLLLGGPPYRTQLLAEALTRPLVEAGHRLLTVTWRPAGDRSGGDRPAPGRPVADGSRFGSVAGLAGLAAEVVERLDAGPCAVLGDLLGAHVAIRLAVDRPELVDRLMLTAAAAAPSAMFRTVHEEIAGRAGEPGAIAPRPLALLRAGQLLAPPRLADDEVLAGLLRRLAGVPPEDAADAGPVRAALEARLDPELLARVTRPCLVVAAELDPITPPYQARELARAVPAARLVTVACGHGGAVDAPAQVAAALVDFLAAGHLACR
jgi:thioesterase CepJ